MPEPSIIQVVLMGMITVFVALVVLIVMIKLMSSMINMFAKNSTEAPEFAEAETSDGISEFPDNQVIKAAIAVAIAEDMDEDVSHLRIISIKKL